MAAETKAVLDEVAVVYRSAVSDDGELFSKIRENQAQALQIEQKKGEQYKNLIKGKLVSVLCFLSVPLIHPFLLLLRTSAECFQIGAGDFWFFLWADLWNANWTGNEKKGIRRKSSQAWISNLVSRICYFLLGLPWLRLFCLFFTSAGKTRVDSLSQQAVEDGAKTIQEERTAQAKIVKLKYSQLFGFLEHFLPSVFVLTPFSFLVCVVRDILSLYASISNIEWDYEAKEDTKGCMLDVIVIFCSCTPHPVFFLNFPQGCTWKKHSPFAHFTLIVVSFPHLKLQITSGRCYGKITNQADFQLFLPLLPFLGLKAQVLCGNSFLLFPIPLHPLPAPSSPAPAPCISAGVTAVTISSSPLFLLLFLGKILTRESVWESKCEPIPVLCLIYSILWTALWTANHLTWTATAEEKVMQLEQPHNTVVHATGSVCQGEYKREYKRTCEKEKAAKQDGKEQAWERTDTGMFCMCWESERPKERESTKNARAKARKRTSTRVTERE